MITISRELAENLIDDLHDLVSHNSNMRAYPRYDNRCKIYEKEIEELKEALDKEQK